MALITPQTAKEMAARSHQARNERIEKLRIAANPVPLPADDSYVQRRLYRVREQIEMLSTMLDNEDDPQRIDRLASALARLSETERQLAGRPLPGSLKPSSPRQQRQVGPVAPQAIQPVVGQAEPEQPK